MIKTNWNSRTSIHILTRQRHDYLSCLLTSLINQTYINWDLSILDNNDEGIELDKHPLTICLLRKIKYAKHNVTILRAKEEIRKNIGLSRNLLIESETNKYACRVDDDSILDPHYLEYLWLGMKDTTTAAVGGVVPTIFAPACYKYPPPIFNEIKRSTVPERYIELSNKYPDIEGGFKNEDEEYYNVGEPMPDSPYLYPPTALTILPSHHLQSSYLFSIDALKCINGFPSSDDTGFREETIASILLLEKGFKLYTNTQAIAYHCWAPNLGRATPPEEHERKILKNEINFQRNYQSTLRKLFDRK